MSGTGVRAGGVCAWLCAVLLGAAAHASERPLGLEPSGPSRPDSLAACTADGLRLPGNLRVAADFMPRVRQMLRRSPTFRAQCRRLAAAPWVHVAVRLNPMLSDRHGLRAATTIQRPQTKLIVAIVSLQGLADPAMWVSHEFEHLIEQIEAVNVERLATAGIEAWPSGSGMYETQRAIRAGEMVLDEVRAYDQAAANFVDE